MKKRVPDKFWFPWWPGKWIFGSVRIEFSPAERGIWVDLLSFASMDDGHIRANEETPYLIQQLAGMLIIPEDELAAAINKFIKSKKLTKLKSGTLYVTKWDKYQFTDRHKRRVESEMSAKKDTIAGNQDAIINKNTLNKNKVKNTKEEYTPEFESFWKEYPRKEGKEDAFITWRNLTKKIQAEIIQASNNYADAMIAEKRDKQYCWKPKTFINAKAGRWKDYLEPVEKPKQIGESKYKPTDKEKERQKSIEAYRTELLKKYKPEIDKAKRAKDFDRLNDIEDTIKTEVAQRSQEI